MTRLAERYQAVAFAPPTRRAGVVRRKAVHTYIVTSKRQAIRMVRRATLPLGLEASGAVYAEPSNALVYQCTVYARDNGRPALRVDEL
jgi:hypothetical protein